MTDLQENRLAQILDEYLAKRRAGGAEQPEDLIGRHPDLADDLADCLSCLNLVERGFEVADKGAPEQLPGGILGDFRIIREVGRGGMGVVYEAEQISLGRRVALKVLPFAAVFDDRHLQRFKNEAQAAASLHHTHIVPVHAVGQERGVHYYAMQFIDGRSLAQVVEELRRGPPEPSQPLSVITKGKSTRDAEYSRAVARIGIQAAEGLAHAHDRGVVHRDIKPANLMVDPLGHLWVTDFGLATIQRSDSNLTLTGDLLGTVRYMSPEQALAKRVPIDHRTDIYSLGVTLYELLTLQPAFPGSNVQQVMEAIAFREPTLARNLNGAIPLDLETILLKTMAKDPGERYSDAEALRADLVRFLEDKPIRARRPSLLTRVEKWARRHRPLVLIGIASLLVLSLVLIWTNLRVSTAYRETEAQRRRAESDFARARRAVKQMLAQAGAEELSDVPLMEPVRRKLLEGAIDFYEEWLSEARDDPELRAEVAGAYEDLADVKRLLGDYEAAVVDYSLAAEHADDPGRIWHRIGNCREQQGDLDGADAALQKALALRRARGSVEWAATLNALARVAGLRKDDEAEERYVAFALELLEQESTSEARFQLARTLLTDSARTFMAERESSAVSTARALEILRQLAAESDAPRVRRQLLGEVLLKHAHIAINLGERARAAPLLREAIGVLEPLARQYPFMPVVRSLLCDAQWDLGRCVGGKEAESLLREAVRGGEEIAALFPRTPGRDRHLALYHQSLGTALHRTDAETAQRSFAESERLLKDLVARFHGETGYALDLGHVLFARSNTLPFPENVRVVREAIKLLRPIHAAESDRAEYRNRFANYHNQAGTYLSAAGRREEAATEFRKAIELRRGRADLDARRGLATALMNLGMVLRDQQKMVAAEEALRESIAI
ncbi:MAG: protein kinase domain-containing protein, partial [Planctomycetota bacterium]